MDCPEEDFLPLSALQHMVFCERQCALIHVERVWADNELTVQGALVHATAHAGRPETRDHVRVLRGVALVSRELRVRGVADVVEHHADGRWVPVEYKRGRPKAADCDRVQLCAQAMCLEEMLGAAVPRGVLYYGATRRRQDVVLDSGLRQLTRDTAERLHRVVDSGLTPPAVVAPKCARCSLRAVCLPEASQRPVRRTYLASMARTVEEDG